MEHKTIRLDQVDAKVKGVESENPNGEFEAVLVTSALDRDGEYFEPKAFEPLPKSIPIHLNHDLRNPIGRGFPVYDDEKIVVKGYFASTEDAQTVRTKVNEGIIDSMSVGFIKGVREKKNGKTAITRAEMFEGTLTAIPANTEALVLSSKEAKVGARNNVVDAERIQNLHDVSVELGAACGKHIHEADAEGKEAADESPQPETEESPEAEAEATGSETGVSEDTPVEDPVDEAEVADEIAVRAAGIRLQELTSQM